MKESFLSLAMRLPQLLLAALLLTGCGGEGEHRRAPSNQPPVAVSDHFRMLSTDRVLEVAGDGGVLGNDSDAEGDAFSAELVTPPQHDAGGFVLRPNGGFHYELADRDAAADRFVYRAVDASGASADTVVDIEIEPNNDPVARADEYRIIDLDQRYRVSVQQGVLANDEAHVSDSLHAELVTPPAHHEGDFVLHADGSFDFRIAPGKETQPFDTFTYVAVDGKYRSEPATVKVVFVQNTPPRARSLRRLTDATSAPFSGSLAPLVEDDENTVFNFFDVTPADAGNRGTLVIDRITGEFTYTPPEGATPGYQDAFAWQVDDLHGATATATLTIAVGPKRIMPLGDSITYGVTSSHIDEKTGELVIGPANDWATGYRLPLARLLDDAGCAYDFVGNRSSGDKAGLHDPDHQGIPGIRSGEVDDFITTWLDQSPPDIVLLHIGSNNYDDDGLNPDVSSIDSILTKIRDWARQHDNPVQVLVAKIIDQGPFVNAVGPFNDNLEALIRGKWPDVILVDQFHALSYPDDISPRSVDMSNLHPTAGGYEKMGRTWFDAMRRAGLLLSCRDK